VHDRAEDWQRPTRAELGHALRRLLDGAGPGEAENLRAFILSAGRPEQGANREAHGRRTDHVGE
jgi:hypothetical protein